MKICLAQTNIVWEDKAANMRRCRELMKEAVESGAELVIFPELSLTGFTMNASLAEHSDGETVLFFQEITRELHTAAAFGFACNSNGRITNRLCIADHGNITAEYDKIHPFSYGGECNVYSGGARIVTAKVCGMTVGLSVCYDLRFPEIYQAMSEGCQLILVIANWPDSRMYHWNTLMRARAIENQCYIAGCNRCGTGGGLVYSGGSMICSPTGEVISAAEPYKKQLIYADISKEEVSGIRNGFPLKKDRRQNLYKDFYAK